MEIIKKKWDSDFFNLKIGQLEINDPKEFKLNKFRLLAKSYDLVYVFCDQVIEGLKQVDNKEIFHLKDIDKQQVLITDCSTISFSSEKHSYQELLDLTLQSGVYSRFKIDTNFNNNEYEKLYTEWINKSISKELAIDIIIKLSGFKIVGFTTLTKKTNELADIGLVAVDENYRGQGVAKELINRTIDRAKNRGFKEIQVVTQNNNIPARRLYSSSGFKSIKTTNIYHYWNYDTIQ